MASTSRTDKLARSSYCQAMKHATSSLRGGPIPSMNVPTKTIPYANSYFTAQDADALKVGPLRMVGESPPSGAPGGWIMALFAPACVSISLAVRSVFPSSVVRRLLRDYRADYRRYGHHIRRVHVLDEHAQIIYDVVTMATIDAEHHPITMICLADEVQDLLPRRDAFEWVEIGEFDEEA